MQLKKNEEVFSSKIIKFASYEEYTGKHIYPIVMKTSTISILILILYVIGEYFFRDEKVNFINYFISYSIGALLILMMVYSAYKKTLSR